MIQILSKMLLVDAAGILSIALTTHHVYLPDNFLLGAPVTFHKHTL